MIDQNHTWIVSVIALVCTFVGWSYYIFLAQTKVKQKDLIVLSVTMYSPIVCMVGIFGVSIVSGCWPSNPAWILGGSAVGFAFFFSYLHRRGFLTKKNYTKH